MVVLDDNDHRDDKYDGYIQVVHVDGCDHGRENCHGDVKPMIKRFPLFEMIMKDSACCLFQGFVDHLVLVVV